MRASEKFREYSNGVIAFVSHYFTEITLSSQNKYRLGNYVKEIQTGKTPSKKVYQYWESKDFPWFKPEDIGFSVYLNKTSNKISFKAVENNAATIYHPNTLLINAIGDIGRMGILKIEASSNQQITGILFNEKVMPEYVYFYLLSKKKEFDLNSSSTTLAILNQKKLCSMEIRVPTLETQKEFIRFMFYCIDCFENKKRIIEDNFKLDKEFLEFSKMCFDLSYHKNDLINHFTGNLDQVQKLRQSILQEAVSGKLVPQDQKDESASELLKKIKVEKEKLIREGKIRKDKPLPPITEEEIPYELPKGWEWVRLGEITNFGTSEKADSKKIHPDTWVLDLEDIEKDSSKLLQRLRFKEKNSLSTKSIFYKNDVLYGKLRPYLDKVIVADENGVCTTEILPIRCYIPINAHYIRIYLKNSQFINYVNSKVYGMKMPRLGTDDGRKALFALPSFSEQKRIVEKVDQLMKLCDELETKVKENQNNSKLLIEAVLREAFEVN